MHRAAKSFNTLIGTENDDELIGSKRADFLVGRLGDDTIYGRAGDDSIWGEEGNDQLFGGAGADTFGASSGNDMLDGGGGTDSLTFYDADGVDIDFSSGTASFEIASIAGSLTFASIEIIRTSDGNDIILCGDQGPSVYAREGDDRITGGAGNDWFDPGWGNNTVSGGAGDDTFAIGSGNDILDGGEGIDELHFLYPGSGVRAAVDAETIVLQSGQDGETIHISNFENLRGSEAGDELTGDDNANRLLGEGEGDTLVGLGGDDFIGGGDGEDDLTGGEGQDTFVFGGQIARFSEDNIQDFDVGEDRLLFDSKLFAKLRSSGETEEGGGYAFRALKASQFQSSDGKEARGEDVRLIHDTHGGRLFYDPDGSGKGKDVLLAYIDKDIPALTAADIFVM